MTFEDSPSASGLIVACKATLLAFGLGRIEEAAPTDFGFSLDAEAAPSASGVNSGVRPLSVFGDVGPAQMQVTTPP